MEATITPIRSTAEQEHGMAARMRRHPAFEERLSRGGNQGPYPAGSRLQGTKAIKGAVGKASGERSKR